MRAWEPYTDPWPQEHQHRGQLLCEDRLGSITVGKEADLVVLGDDITACVPEHIQDAPVLGAMVGGNWVYTRA